jgi:GNAT superfamily N-acetyltransferase
VGVDIRQLEPGDDVGAFGVEFGPDVDLPRRRRSLVAVADGRLVGVASATWSSRHVDIVQADGVVDPAWRRQGIGRRLLRDLEVLAGDRLSVSTDDDRPAAAALLDAAGYRVATESWTRRLAIAPAALALVDAEPPEWCTVGEGDLDAEVEALFERVYTERHRWAGRYVSTPHRPWIRWAGPLLPGTLHVARRDGRAIAAASLHSGWYADGADGFLAPTGTTDLDPATPEATAVVRALVGRTLRAGALGGCSTINVEHDSDYLELACVLDELAPQPLTHTVVWMRTPHR